MQTSEKISSTKNVVSNSSSKKSSMSIAEEISIGRMEPTPAKAYDVSLIDSKGQWYVSIRKQYKKKSSITWESGKGMWIPFDDAEQISHLIQKACNEGHQHCLGTNQAQAPATTAFSSINIEKELREVKEKLKDLELHIHKMEANTEQKAQLKLIERILKALS